MKYTLISYCLVLFLISCKSFETQPKNSVTIEFIDQELYEGKKVDIKENIRKRLKAVGAGTVIFEDKEDQSLVCYYQNKIAEDIIKSTLRTNVHLEFYLIYDDLQELRKYLVELAEDLKKEGKEDFMEMIAFGQINLNANFGYIEAQNKVKIDEILMNDEHIPLQLKDGKYVKLLWGKNEGESLDKLFAVITNKENQAPINGTHISESEESYNAVGRPVVNLKMNEEGSVIWEQMTDEAHKTRGNIAVVLNDEIYSAPGVSNGKITGGNSQISGNFSVAEAQELALMIQTGVLPELKIVEFHVEK